MIVFQSTSMYSENIPYFIIIERSNIYSFIMAIFFILIKNSIVCHIPHLMISSL